MATSGIPTVLLPNVAANTTGVRSKCGVNFGFGEQPQACTTFTVDVSTTGSPSGFSIQIQGGINEQGTPANIGSAITSTGLHQVTTTTPVTYWLAVLSGLTGGTSPTVRVVGISAS